MRNRLSSISFNQLYKNLIESKKWFNSLRLPTINNRFDTILKNVDFACKNYNKPNLEEAFKGHPLPDILISLLDADSFIIIYQEFKSLKNNLIPRRSLRNILSGPLLPHDEDKDGSSIHARNTLFEMELAARFNRKGLNIIGFDDIELEFLNTRVNIQCKRLQSESRVQENLDKACSQLSTRMNGTDKKGIVAIGIDKIIGADKDIWTVANEANLMNETKKATNLFLSNNEGKFRRIIDIRILAVLVDLRFIAKVISHGNLLTRGHDTVILPLCSEQTLQIADTNFIQKLGLQIANFTEPNAPPDSRGRKAPAVR